MQNPIAPAASRIGSVGYLNAAPLTRGIERDILFATPAQLAQRLQRDELDAALVSIVEVLFSDRYDVLDGVAIASHGEVKSVLLAHHGPLEQIQTVHCDPASLTSVSLLRVLLGERGLQPEFRPLARYADAARQEAVLLIGDPALDFLFAPHTHHLWDLGQAWWDLTGLPFVYAAWALRRGADTPALHQRLRAAKDQGLRELDALVRERTEYDHAFRKTYLGGNIRYDLGPAEKRGVARFVELLRRHQPRPVHEPRYVA
jgi:chorismate dehydratase